MDPKVREFVEAQKIKPVSKITVAEFMRSFNVGISFLKEHNHEIWRKCICGNEEDLRKTFRCSVCGNILYKPSKKKYET